MSSEAWVGVLAILVGVLTAAVGALLVFLFNQAIKINTLEQRVAAIRREFQEPIRELRGYLFRRKRQHDTQTDDPDTGSDEGGESQHQDW